jgi:hypothetical protein
VISAVLLFSDWLNLFYNVEISVAMALWPTIAEGGLISESFSHLLQFPPKYAKHYQLERRWCMADVLGYWSQFKKLSEVKPPLKVSTRISYQYYKKVTVMQKSGV